MVKVFNLALGEYVAEYTCTPREAVIAAHAQLDHKDFNTWDYEKRYGHLVKQGQFSVNVGDYSAITKQTPITA